MPNRYTISKETRLKLAIESKLGWGSSENWSTKDFQNLSKYIEEATGVLLSVTTLKRFFGKVNAETSPSSSTLDTLSVFLGYQSWLAFSENGRHQLYASPRKSLFTYLLKIPPAFIPYGKILLLIGILAGLALISGFFVQFEGGLSLPEDIPFEIKKVSQGLPNTVVFKYDVSGLNYNEIEIQQSWDKSKRITVKKGSKETAVLYRYPGYYRAKLVVDDQIVEERDLYIASDGWLAAIEYPEAPRYLLEEEWQQNGLFQASPSIVEKLGKADAFYWMSFYYLKEFEQLTGSDFHLKTAFKNTLKHGGNSCQKTKLRLIGTEGVISIHFSIPGCVADNLIYLNGNFIRGNENDLSFLGCDFSGFIPIQVKKEGKIFQLTKDDKVVFQDTLAYDLGKIAGMSFHFMGAGAIDYVHFTNKEQVLIQDNFQ